MKKKRVTAAPRKKTAKRVSSARTQPVSNRKKTSAKKTAPAERSRRASAAKKSKPKNLSSGRSIRVSKTLQAASLRLAKTKSVKSSAASVEPMSCVLPVETIHDIPFSYNKTEIVLLPRDPYWAFTYWDFSGETWNWITVLRERDHGAQPKLRVHNLDQRVSYDKDIDLEAKNWYLELGFPNTSFEVELGILDSSGKFHRIALSNRIKTPRSGPSEQIDPDWELSGFELSELYRLSGGGRERAGSEVFSSLKRPKTS